MVPWMMVPFLSSMSTVSWLSFIRKRTNFILLGLRESGRAPSVACVAQGPIYTLRAVLAADTRRQQCERVPCPLANEPSRAKEGEIADVSNMGFLCFYYLVTCSTQQQRGRQPYDSGEHERVPRQATQLTLCSASRWSSVAVNAALALASTYAWITRASFS